MTTMRIKKFTIIGLGLCVMLMAQGSGGSEGAEAADSGQGVGQPALSDGRIPEGMVLIPGGTISGTNPLAEGEAHSTWYPSTYDITMDDFLMDKHLVTKALWDEVYNWALTHGGYSFDNAGTGKAEDHAVDTLNWYDAVKWCNARSEKEGRSPVYTVNGAAYRTGRSDNVVQSTANGYRLPTMDEWEYAARGGLQSKRFPWGDEINHDHAIYFANSKHRTYDTSTYTAHTHHPTYRERPYPFTSPVGSFAANGYGLYDMAGNLLEWNYDWHPSYMGSHRVLRGGSWNSKADLCRVGVRINYSPGITSHITGFRTVRPPDPADTP